MKTNKKVRKPIDKDELRENVLRPSSYLGYNRDDLGMHLMGREAFEIAEVLFRRAVWLNPFEPEFKEHLAWSLFQQHRYCEALPIIEEAIVQQPDTPRFRELRRLIANRINDNGNADRPAS